ncbi:radical SAM protein [bacterium]|nr:radical SAM protein [bacterium]
MSDTTLKRARIALISLNIERNYALALYYLKLYALQDPDLRDRLNINIIEMGVRISPVLAALRIALTRPSIAGFSCNIWNIRRTLETIRILKRLLPKVVVIIGGQEITNSEIDYLKEHPEVDICVDGEGEETFRRLLRSYIFDDMSSLDDIPAISFRKGDRQVSNPPGMLIDNLDSIPSPYLAHEIRIGKHNHLGIMIETSRGCRFRCTFCFEGKKYAGVRYFSISRVEKEIADAVKNGVRHFHFLDPIVGNNDISRLEQISNILSKHVAGCGKYTCSVEIYAELINDKNVGLLKHFTLFDVGLQSINPSALTAINRTFVRDRFINGVRLLQALNKHVSVYLLLGLAGDNFFSFLEGVRFVYSLNVDKLFINLLCVLNGTQLRTDAARLGITYMQDPPYFVLKNDTFSEAELAMAKVFAETITKEHGATAMT